jgi:hypothetical protein
MKLICVESFATLTLIPHQSAGCSPVSRTPSPDAEKMKYIELIAIISSDPQKTKSSRLELVQKLFISPLHASCNSPEWGDFTGNPSSVSRTFKKITLELIIAEWTINFITKTNQPTYNPVSHF